MSREDVRVRIAEFEDLARVVALERAVAEAPHWGEAEYEAMVGPKLRNEVRRCLLVAENLAGDLVGFAVGKVIGSGYVAELESVAVDPAARRCGVGRALCRAVAEWCGLEGAEALELEVRAASEGAIALYAGLGFVIEGRRSAYYQDPIEDALLMRMELVEPK